MTIYAPGIIPLLIDFVPTNTVNQYVNERGNGERVEGKSVN